jgi:hypothetical protein
VNVDISAAAMCVNENRFYHFSSCAPRYKPGPFVDIALEVLNLRGNARALSYRKHSKEWNILSQFFRNVLVDIKLPKKTVTKKIVGLVEAAGRFPFTQEQEDGSSLPTTVAVRSASIAFLVTLHMIDIYAGILPQNIQHTPIIS